MTKQLRNTLLAVDSIINAVLGLCLLAVPATVIDVLGLPKTDSYFYVTVLGAVLLGIAIALWIERRHGDRWTGLGLVGAAVINLLGAGTVLVWLLLGPLTMPTRGHVVLWAVVVIVFAAGLVELAVLLHRGRR